MILAIILGTIGLATGATRLGIKIRQNRQAKKAGKAKPNSAGDLALEGLDLANSAATLGKGVKR